MGQLCSCHRAQRTWSSGKAISQDYLLSRPAPRSNGCGPHHDYYNARYTGYDVMPGYAEDAASRSPYAASVRSSSLRLRGSGFQKADYSYSTIGPESGFSSKASSSFDNANHSSSVPSTPETMIRRKPPPKPPRMRTSTDTLLRTPTPSAVSAGVQTLKSSIVDVTNALDNTLLHSFDSDRSTGENRGRRPSPERGDATSAAHEKVSGILDQARQFLAFELEADGIVTHLCEKAVITRRDAAEIRAGATERARCERLIDRIAGRGRNEFMTFCNALRSIGSLGYLADFLDVLDTLVELATTGVMRPVDRGPHSPDMTTHAFSLEADDKSATCPCNNNCDDDGDGDGGDGAPLCEEASFDVDIFYVNKETDERRSVREVTAMGRRRSPLSVASDDVSLLEEADRYIPVISASLYNQCLRHGGVKSIARLLADYPCIRELSLVKNHVGADGMKTLADALERNRGLAKLDIRLNQIGDDGALHLSRAISGHPSLRALKLTSTGLGGAGCCHLVRGIGRSPRLAELDIGFNELSEAACEALGKCLAANPSLRRLRVRGNGMTPYGARCVFRGLRRNSRVKYLDVSRNRVRDESVAVLCEVLLANRTLREINMENCGISAVGCSSLARALKTNTSLRRLELSMNNLGDGGALALGEGLKYNKAMETLCLNMCDIGNVGFLGVLEALRHNTTMSTLKLCYNNIGKANGPDAAAAEAAAAAEGKAARGGPGALMTERREDAVLILKSPPIIPSADDSLDVGAASVDGANTASPSPSFNADCSPYVNSPSLSTDATAACRPTSLPLVSGPASDAGSEQSPGYGPRDAVLDAPSPSSASIPPLPLASRPPASQSSISSPLSLTSPPLSPTSPPLSPRSPLIASLRQSFTGRCTASVRSLEQMYETLCEVLQQNKDLKVLLWGNNFDDGQEDRLITEVTSDGGGGAVQLRDDT